MPGVATYESFGPFFSSNQLVVNPKIYHYTVDTTTTKDVWMDKDKTITAPQPVVGDADGFAYFYGDGLYDIVIKDQDDTTLYTWDDVQIGPPYQHVAFSAHLGGKNQVSIATATLTKVDFASQPFDEHDTFNFGKWIPGRTGKAFVLARATYVSLPAATQQITAIYQNGTSVKVDEHVINGASSSIGELAFALLSVAATTDYFEIYSYQGSGSDQVISGDITKTFMMGAMLE